MADYLAKGNKTIRCKNGHLFQVPFQETLSKCPICGLNVCTTFHGVIESANGSYVY